MEKLYILLATLITINLAKAQPTIEWQKSLGGTYDDYAYLIQQTTDGGYIIAGESLSNDGDVTGHYGTTTYNDYWVVKLNSIGTIAWQKSLGGTYDDRATSIQQTMDGGYIVAGHSKSNDGDVTGHHGTTSYYDYWVVKLNSTGTIEWQKSLGGTFDDWGQSIQQTTDSGYIIAGYSSSNDGDVTGHHGTTTTHDYWVVKLNSTGTIEWQKSLGGTYNDDASSIQQTTDGGYIVAGVSSSNDGDVTGHHGTSNYEDYWVVKLNSTGIIAWQKSLGGTSSDFAESIRQTTDGGYIVAGFSSSNDGDVTGNHGSLDYWVVKLNPTGTIAWQKSLGGTDVDLGLSIHQTTDSGYIIAGSCGSNDGDVTVNHGFYDYWVVKLNSTGTIQWQKSFGGTISECAYSILQTTDGGYIVAGMSFSNNGDVTGHHGTSSTNDYWVVKLSPDVGIKDINKNNSNINVYPNPANTEITIELICQNSLVGICNISGQEIMQLKARSQKLKVDVSNLPSGIYFVKVVTAKGVEIKKFIKE
jgi:hypothetical protein